MARNLTGVFLVGAVVCALGAAWLYMSAEEPPTRPVDQVAVSQVIIPDGVDAKAFLTDQFKMAAERMTGTLPKKLDEATLLREVTAGPEPSMTYVYDVFLTEGMGTPEEVFANIRKGVTDYACSTQNMRKPIDAGALYRYVYTDGAGKVLFDYTIDKAVCTK